MITASCHCGAVRMELAEAPTELTDCNCSICRRLGALWAYYHPGHVEMRGARDATLSYVWGDKMLEFHSCKTCGCTTHWEPVEKAGAQRMGINMRLADPAAFAGVRVRLFDGADTWKPLGWSVYPPIPMKDQA